MLVIPSEKRVSFGTAGLLQDLTRLAMPDERLSRRYVNAPLSDCECHADYNVLHAAAATMYQRAKRLSVMSMEPGLAMDILTAQCQSYLVAINVLELQAPEKRFIMVETDGAQHSQPKVSCDLPKLQGMADILCSASGRECASWMPNFKIQL